MSGLKTTATPGQHHAGSCRRGRGRRKRGEYGEIKLRKYRCEINKELEKSACHTNSSNNNNNNNNNNNSYTHNISWYLIYD
jgi:hypothetical protein